MKLTLFGDSLAELGIGDTINTSGFVAYMSSLIESTSRSGAKFRIIVDVGYKVLNEHLTKIHQVQSQSQIPEPPWGQGPRYVQQRDLALLHSSLLMSWENLPDCNPDTAKKAGKGWHKVPILPFGTPANVKYAVSPSQNAQTKLN